jgi:hypothetical protein
MSYAQPTAPPPPVPPDALPPPGSTARPGAVTAAGLLLMVMAAGGLAYAVIGAVTAGGTIDRFRSAAAARGVSAGDIDATVGGVVANTAIIAIVGALVAVLLLVLALGVLRGRPGYRTTTWVVCALGLLCGGGALVWSLVQRAGRWDAATLEALAPSYPSWWLWLSSSLSVAQALGYVVVALLLALPAATAFFRRPS